MRLIVKSFEYKLKRDKNNEIITGTSDLHKFDGHLSFRETSEDDELFVFEKKTIHVLHPLEHSVVTFKIHIPQITSNNYVMFSNMPVTMEVDTPISSKHLKQMNDVWTGCLTKIVFEIVTDDGLVFERARYPNVDDNNRISKHIPITAYKEPIFIKGVVLSIKDKRNNRVVKKLFKLDSQIKYGRKRFATPRFNVEQSFAMNDEETLTISLYSPVLLVNQSYFMMVNGPSVKNTHVHHTEELIWLVNNYAVEIECVIINDGRHWKQHVYDPTKKKYRTLKLADEYLEYLK